MDIFSYGNHILLQSRQLASLAVLSTRAMQSITTSQSEVIGWTGTKFTKEKADTPFMVRTCLCMGPGGPNQECASILQTYS